MAVYNTWNHLEFNNTEGGLFLSYTNKNGAKVGGIFLLDIKSTVRSKFIILPGIA